MQNTLAQEKAFNAFVYFAKQIKPLYLTKAIKLLYIADEKAIRHSGVPITWLNYKAWNYGPAAEEISIIHQLCVSAPSFNLIEGSILESREDFDDSQFSDYEIDVLDSVIVEYGGFSGEQLVEVLHKEGTLLHKVVKRDYLEQQFALKNNRSDFVSELTELLDTDFKKSAFEVAYQSFLMQANLM